MDRVRERKRSVCYIKPKLIYVEFNGKVESIELSSQCSSEDLQDVLKSICGAGRRDIIKLYSNASSGGQILLPINNSNLDANVPHLPYRLQLISCCPQLYTTIISQGSRKSLQDLDNRIRNLESIVQRIVPPIQMGNRQSISHRPKVTEMESRVSRLQLHMSTAGSSTARHQIQRRDTSEALGRCLKCPFFENICPLRQSVHLADLANIAHQPEPGTTNENAKKTAAICDWSRIVKSHNQFHTVWLEYQKLKMNELTNQTKQQLCEPQFNMWAYSDAELISLVRHMFVSLDLIGQFNIPLTRLDNWLGAIYQSYNSVPFHNFTHAFCVVQMLYSIIHQINIQSILSSLDILSLMFAALSHDLDHPGFNNSFQVNAKTSLARRYNDQSPLENHHCAMAFHLIEDDSDNNILTGLSDRQLKHLRDVTIKCILGTDMARHSEIISEFKSILPTLNLVNNSAHRSLLMVVLIKICDISNESRPQHISEPWVERLLEEFFIQSDYEKLHGLPWAPFMDRDRATKSNSQVGFIKFVILPLFEILGQVFPVFKEKYVSIVHCQLDYYTKLQDNGSSSNTNATVPPAANNVSSAILSQRRQSCCVPKAAPPPTGPCRKSSAGAMLQGYPLIAPPFRKTSTGSLPSRKSSTNSLVLAHG